MDNSTVEEWSNTAHKKRAEEVLAAVKSEESKYKLCYVPFVVGETKGWKIKKIKRK